jgi:glycosyltransferase involved in cell wall biosynthesis
VWALGGVRERVERMRVAVVGYPLLSERQWRLCERYAADHEVHILVPPAWPDIPPEDAPPANASFEVHRVRTPFAGRQGQYVMPGATAVLRRVRPDVVFTHEEPWNPNAAVVHAAARLAGSSHVLFSWENLERVPRNRAQRAAERALLGRLDGVVAGSEAATGRLGSRGFDGPTAVAPQSGVDTAQFRPDVSAESVYEDLGIPADVPVLLYAGRLAAEKGLETLVEAFAAVDPDAHLALVGSGPLDDALAAATRSRGISGSVTLVTERQPYARMPAILGAASAFAYPSETTAEWAEQFGYSVAEAMSCGVPVVVSDCGALPTVVGDAGRVVPEGDADALAGALTEVLADPELRDRLGEQGRKRVVDRFSLDAVADAHLRLFARVAGSG